MNAEELTKMQLLQELTALRQQVAALTTCTLERQRTQEEFIHFSSAVQMSIDSIVLTDIEGKIIEANDASLAMYGTTDKGDLIGKSAFEQIAPEDQQRAVAGMEEVLEKGYIKSREYQVLTKSGRTIPVEMSVALIKDAAGNPIGFVGISRDISKRKRADAALGRFNEELQVRVAQGTRDLVEKNEQLLHLQQELTRVGPLAALGQVVGTIAHELGTPLNSVLGYSQLLAQEQLSDRARRYVAIIAAQAQRMADTFQHYHSHTQGYLYKHHHIDLNELVRETLVLLELFFQRHQVRVTPALAEALPLLTADGGSLQRMVINLLNNAVDAMEGGGLVTVTTRTSAPSETSRQGVVLEITDTGSGIPPALLPKVFELFFTTKAPGKGAGLGLAICEEIVNEHGGIIKVTSQIGVGTCVWVFLPTEEERGDHLRPVKEEG